MHITCFILEVLASSKSESPYAAGMSHSHQIKITSHMPACPRETGVERQKRSVHAVAGAQINREPGGP